MLTFPSEPSCATKEEQIEALIPHQAVRGIHDNAMYLNEYTRRQVAPPIIPDDDDAWIKQRLSLFDLMTSLRVRKAYAPLDVDRLVGESVARRDAPSNDRMNEGSSCYFKLLLACPEMGVCERDDIFCDWIMRKFSYHPRDAGHNQPKQLETLHLSTTERGRASVRTCVHAVIGHPDDDTIAYITHNAVLHGTAAVWFIVTPDLSRESCKEERERLCRVLESKPSRPTSLLVLVLPRDPALGYDLHRLLDLDDLYSQKLVGSVYLMYVDRGGESGADVMSDRFTTQLIDAVNWCVANMPDFPSLQRQYLRDFVEDMLSAEIHGPFLHNLAERRCHLMLHQSPEILVALYNSVVEHTINATTDADLADISWPVTEFSDDTVPWNSPDQIESVRTALTNLYLEDFEHTDAEKDDWSTACKNLYAFMTAIVDNQTGWHVAQFFSRVRGILKKFEREFTEACEGMLEQPGCEPTYGNMPWTDIVLAAVEYKVNNARFTCPVSQSELVVYVDGDATNFEVPAFWREAQREHLTKTSDNPQLFVTFLLAGERESAKAPNDPRRGVDKPATPRPDLDLQTRSREDTDVRNRCASLMSSIAQAKRENTAFNAFLEKSVLSNDLPGPRLSTRCGDQQTPRKLLKYDDESDDGDAYDSTKTNDVTAARHEDSKRSCNGGTLTIAESIDELKRKVTSQRKADDLYETKLRHLIDS